MKKADLFGTKELIYSTIEEVYTSPENVTVDLFLQKGFLPGCSYDDRQRSVRGIESVYGYHFATQFDNSTVVATIEDEKTVSFVFHAKSEKAYFATWNTVLSYYNKIYSLIYSDQDPRYSNEHRYYDSLYNNRPSIFYTISDSRDTTRLFFLEAPYFYFSCDPGIHYSFKILIQHKSA